MLIIKKILLPFLFILFSGSVMLGGYGCQSSGTGGAQVTPVPTATPSSSATSVPTATPTGGWNSFMISFRAHPDQSAAFVLNVDYANGKSATLTQYALHDPQFDGIAPNGKDLLYQQSVNGRTQFYTIFLQKPQTGFFYEQNGDGNAIWMSDSQHVLILNETTGVTEVDVETGQAQQVVSLPYRVQGRYIDRIGSLAFAHNGFLYFVGSGGGDCMGALCRIPLDAHDKSVAHLSGRQMGTTFWLSPDGRTVYYRSTGPVGQLGIYAINSDGTDVRILRHSNGGIDDAGVPIGFTADNSLVIMRAVNGKFQVVQLGATPGQDRVLLANAAPGAVSLCDPSFAGSGTVICDQNIALAPYSHAIVVQGTLSNNARALWLTNLVTGGQQSIHPQGLPDSIAVQLLGWDRLPVCGGNRC